jgi:hypothetical protein
MFKLFSHLIGFNFFKFTYSREHCAPQYDYGIDPCTGSDSSGGSGDGDGTYYHYFLNNDLSGCGSNSNYSWGDFKGDGILEDCWFSINEITLDN